MSSAGAMSSTAMPPERSTQDGKRHDRAPAPTLPLRYLTTAACAFVLATAGTVWLAPELGGHYYHPRLVALTHTVTLGWISLTIMGASHQLLPIVLGRPLWSERLARWQFVIFTAGVAGMISHFYIGTWVGLALAAALAGMGVVLHLVNAWLSLRGLAKWTFTARLMVLAFGGLGLTLIFGLALAVDHIWKFLPGEVFPRLHAHFQLAMLGWVAPMLMGVAARVYPMFLLAEEPTGWPGMLQLWGLGLGVPTLVVGLLAVPWLVIPAALAVTAAGAGHLAWVSAMAADRKRPALDWGLRFAFTGTAFLIPSAALGLGLASGLLEGPRLALAYAVLVLGGWVSITIVGMLLKIVPFLVWYRVYGPRVGRGPVPTLNQLSWPAAEGLAFAFLTTGLVGLTTAVAVGDITWIRASAAVLTAGSLVFTLALARVLRHLLPSTGWRPPATTRLHPRLP